MGAGRLGVDVLGLQSVLTAYAELLLFGIVDLGEPGYLVARLDLVFAVPLAFGATLANELPLATVEVACVRPPAEVTFEHVPADDRRAGYVTCPAGTTAPEATVASWTEA